MPPRSLEVVLVGPVPSRGLKAIQASTRTVCNFQTHPYMHENRSLLKKLATADVVVAQYFTEAMARAAGRLRLLHAVGAGVDTFCLPALRDDTIVANVYYHGPAIAEFAMMMMMALSRNLLVQDAGLRRGRWTGSWVWGAAPANELVGTQVGIIGFGHIGRELAKRAKAFGMTVWTLSPRPLRPKTSLTDRWVGPRQLRELLQKSDYVVIACPLNESTKGLLGFAQFSWMKESAFLVNIARAGIVKEAALFRALKTGRIAGAALDVWNRLPINQRPCKPANYPFHKLPNVIMTPHIAGWTTGTFARRFRQIADNIDRLATERRLMNMVQKGSR
jgi:phosphoglycerate dehydrogenase-like enzyme